MRVMPTCQIRVTRPITKSVPLSSGVIKLQKWVGWEFMGMTLKQTLRLPRFSNQGVTLIELMICHDHIFAGSWRDLFDVSSPSINRI